MQLFYKGELVVTTRLSGATMGYRCDEIRLDVLDWYELVKCSGDSQVLRGKLHEQLDQWLCRFAPGSLRHTEPAIAWDQS